MRVVFLGTSGAYSTVPLRAILARHRIVRIYEGIRRPESALLRAKQAVRRRLIEVALSCAGKDTLKTIAQEHGIAYQAVYTMNDDATIAELKSVRPDAICIASFTELLSPPVLAIPLIGTINAHGSLLPEYRGRNPFFWIVRDGLMTSGITLHWATEKADAGNILGQKSIDLFYGMTAGEYGSALAFAGSTLFPEVLAACEAGALTGMPNSGGNTRYCRNPKPDDLEIRPEWSPEHALWFYRVARSYGTPFIRVGQSRMPVACLSPVQRRSMVRVEFSPGSLWCEWR